MLKIVTLNESFRKKTKLINLIGPVVVNMAGSY